MSILFKIKAGILKQIEILSFREKVLLAIVSIVLPSFLYGYLYVRPKIQEIKKLRLEIFSLRKEINRYRSLALKKEFLEKQLKEKEVFLKRLIVMLPSEKEIPDLLSSVAEKAKKSGLKVISFTPKTEKSKDYYKIIPFNIEVKGNFKQLILFLNEIINLPRLISLKDLEINMKQNKNWVFLIAKCAFNTYRYTGEILPKEENKKQKKKK